jgi:hypothetical protein
MLESFLASEIFQSIIAPVIVTLLAGAVTWLGVQASTLVRTQAAKVKNDTVARVLEVLGVAATTAVTAIAQTAVNKLKANSADGRLTPEEAQAALQAARDQAWATIGKEGRQALVALVGSQSAALQKIVEPAIERAVAETKGLANETVSSPERREGELRLARARLGLQ